MKNTLTKCPRCGSSLIKYTNKKTNKFFTKCSNKDCHFSLRDNYYEEEIPLQGVKLESKCLGCGQPLEVTCGPLGLYARCYHCNYDLNPQSVNGELVVRWANAYPQKTKDEINSLIIQYKKNKEAQIGFDEEEYSAQLENQESTPKKPHRDLDTENKLYFAGFTGKAMKDCSLILDTFMQDTSLPLSSKDVFEKLSNHINSACSIISYLRALRNADFIKIVKYEENLSSVKIYYQIKSSPLEEIKVYTEDEGYTSISNFFKNSDFYSTSIRTQVARVLRSNNEPTFLVQHERGFYAGYKTKTLEKIIVNLEENRNKKDDKLLIQELKPIEIKKSTIEHTYSLKEAREHKEKIRQQILEILKKDINTGYTSSKITNILNIEKQLIVDSVRTLKRQKKIKIVGTEIHKEQGNYSFVFQSIDSPLRQVIIKTSAGCIALKEFFAKHKKELNEKDYYKVLKKVRENQLKEHLVLIHKRPFIGYKESELERIFKIKKVDKASVELKTKKTSKFSTQVTGSPKKDKNFLSNVFKFFQKKKSENPEIIHF